MYKKLVLRVRGFSAINLFAMGVFAIVGIVAVSNVAMAADAIPSTSLDWAALSTELFTKLTPALTAFAGIALGVAIVVAAVRWIRNAVR